MAPRKKKRGRPRKRGGTKKQKEIRKMWREASVRYYKKNKRRVLDKAKKKSGRKK